MKPAEPEVQWHVFDRAVAAIAVTDATGRLSYVNDAFVRLWGYDEREQCLGLDACSLWADPDAAAPVDRSLEERGEWAGHVAAVRRDGAERLVRVSAVVVEGPDGPATVGTYVDQTDLHRAHSRLRAEEERLQALFERAPVGMFELGPTGEIKRVNASFCDTLARAPAQVLGQDLHAFTHREDRPAVRERIVELGSTTTSIEYTCRIVRPDGARRWVEVRLTSTPQDEEGTVVGVLRDVTAEREAREALARSEARFRVIAHQVESAFWLARSDYSEVLYLSPAVERIWAVPPERIESDPAVWMERLHPEDREWVIAAHEASPTRYAHRHRIIRPDGEVRWVSVRVVPVETMEDVIVGVAADVTENVLAERAREAAYQELANSAAENEMLLHEVHHRVKNNLQVISSMLTLAEQDAGPQATILTDSRARVLAMALVHETLYASGQFQTVDLRVYVRRLLDQLVSVWQEQARDLEVSLHTDPVSLSVDRAIPLGLVLNELVTNALKHAFVCRGTSGNLGVSVRLVPAGELELEVTDDGCGFRREEVRSDTLGLSITDALVGQLGGQLEITCDGGTCVTVRVPLVDRSATEG